MSGGILTTIFDSVDVTRRLLDVAQVCDDDIQCDCHLPEVPLFARRWTGLWRVNLRVQFSGGLKDEEEEAEGLDAWALGQILALLEELGESLPEWAHETIGDGVTTGQELLMGVINGDLSSRCQC